VLIKPETKKNTRTKQTTQAKSTTTNTTKTKVTPKENNYGQYATNNKYDNDDYLNALEADNLLDNTPPKPKVQQITKTNIPPTKPTQKPTTNSNSSQNIQSTTIQQTKTNTQANKINTNQNTKTSNIMSPPNPPPTNNPLASLPKKSPALSANQTSKWSQCISLFFFLLPPFYSFSSFLIPLTSSFLEY